MAYPVKHLYRDTNNAVLGGVCSGLAKYFEIDPVLVRLLWIILTLISFGLGIVAYIIAWFIIPKQRR